MQEQSTGADSTAESGEVDEREVTVSGLEADVAYFDARLSLLSKEPTTRYQSAQVKTYRVLEDALAALLADLRSRGYRGGRG